MYELKDIIKDAEERKVAIGHFNISNMEALWGIFNAAKNLDVPVIQIDKDTLDVSPQKPLKPPYVMIGTNAALALLADTHLTLACVVNADRELARTEFRAQEELFLEWWNLGEQSNELIIQTTAPESPFLNRLSLRQFDEWVMDELAMRKRFTYPPFCDIVKLIIEAKNQYTRSRITIQKVTVADDSGTVDINWFNQPYLMRVLGVGDTISVAGLVKQFGSKISIEPKEYEKVNFDVSTHRSILKHTGRIIPIYSEKKGLSTKTIREKIFFVLRSVVDDDNHVMPESLPPEIVSFNNLIPASEAYFQIHFPRNLEQAKKARERLAFDELFALQLANTLVKKGWKKEKVKNIFDVEKQNLAFLQTFINNLPFKLTDDQKKAIKEIIADLKKTTPMNRFLQGDVGSGKTIVAASACYLSYLNGYQSIIMAPTEILAEQHFNSISELFNYKLRIK